MHQKYFALCCFALMVSVSTTGQNVSSPYSILGIGDIETNDYGRFSASGSAAVSRREPGFYNFYNPASLTVMPYKSINFDFAFCGRVSQFKLPGTDTLTSLSKDFIVKRITIAFKVTPTLGIAFGLKPFSSVNYQYAELTSLDGGNADYAKYTDGSGGIYQSYFTAGKAINKHLSVGATASWLFGSLQNSTNYYNPLLGLDIVKKEDRTYYAAGLQGGVQYYSLPEKKWQHAAGLTAAVYTKLKGQNTIDYQESGSTIKSLDPENIQFKLPVSLSAGYSIANKNGISLHLQGSYHKWPTQKLSYTKSFVKDAYGINAGMEYSKKINVSNGTIEKYYVGWGIKMAQTYLVVNNKHLNEYSVTLGGGKNISRFLVVNAGFEAGRKGETSIKQIRENYYQFSIGMTLKDIWFGTRKFGRFN